MSLEAVVSTDEALADLVEAHSSGRRLPPCEVKTPAFTGSLRGRVLKLRATGSPLSAEAATISPRLAELAGETPRTMPALQPGWSHPQVVAADYPALVAALEPLGVQLATEDQHAARLATCRACPHWSEPAPPSHARCNHPSCHCSRRLPWLLSATCPALKWHSAGF